MIFLDLKLFANLGESGKILITLGIFPISPSKLNILLLRKLPIITLLPNKIMQKHHDHNNNNGKYRNDKTNQKQPILIPNQLIPLHIPHIQTINQSQQTRQRLCINQYLDEDYFWIGRNLITNGWDQGHEGDH